MSRHLISVYYLHAPRQVYDMHFNEFITKSECSPFNNRTQGYFTLGGKLVSSLYRAVKDTILGILVGIIILSILLAKNIVGNSTAALQLAAVNALLNLLAPSYCQLPTLYVSQTQYNCIAYYLSDLDNLIAIFPTKKFDVMTGHCYEHDVRDISHVPSRLWSRAISKTSMDAEQFRLLLTSHSDARFI